ncbi:hypothetical protein Rhopal_007257-T1 [Rhodotorula paludigena]|uniref:ferric-chelate reductase (NADPH) n=1 Tax=Rhodotorula paludigena TaxID=86838 RepID=A0AAV5GV87_9BASI|nr:hypothetical protein Rhopal_007257-T1 [Rhodotorula paludigena]
MASHSDLAASFSHLLPRHSHAELTPAEIAETRIDPYDEATKYAKAAVIAIAASIALYGICNHIASFAYRRAVAFYRYVETSQPKALGWIRFPTSGAVFVIVMFWLFILIWSLAVWPYYRSRWNVGSPPLAIRTGMFALGCFPFIFAFGAKWNIVGFIVGCSHEKLQVFHQWLSHLFLILSLLHTFPFVYLGMKEIRPNTDGLNPDHLSQIAWSWHIGKVYYWSGTAALIPLAWLCWASYTPIRNWSYEFFKYTHIISAILFSAFFYIHCNALLTSWHYIWATAAIYLTSFVVRFGLMIVRNGRHLARGRVEALADNAIRVTIRLPRDSGHGWTAGQHYFVNFCKVRPFESHPYTIANAPRNDPSSTAASDRLVFVFRVNPTRGLGPRLLSLAASSSPTTPVLLDGPYGGLTAANRDFGRHDALILLAGGSGMTFCTAILEEICGRVLREEPGVKVKKIEVWWTVRNESAKSWFDEQMSRAVEHMPEGFVTFRLFVTGQDGKGDSSLADEKLDKEDSPNPGSSVDQLTSSSSLVPWTIEHARPHLPTLLHQRFASTATGSTLGIASCGPPSFTTDVRRAVAAKHKQLAFSSNAEGLAEVELHTEEFDW